VFLGKKLVSSDWFLDGEQARRFAIDSNADNKGALFMWKLGQMKKLKVKKS
jgi:hypothetical protein